MIKEQIEIHISVYFDWWIVVMRVPGIFNAGTGPIHYGTVWPVKICANQPPKPPSALSKVLILLLFLLSLSPPPTVVGRSTINREVVPNTVLYCWIAAKTSNPLLKSWTLFSLQYISDIFSCKLTRASLLWWTLHWLKFITESKKKKKNKNLCSLDHSPCNTFCHTYVACLFQHLHQLILASDTNSILDMNDHFKQSRLNSDSEFEREGCSVDGAIEAHRGKALRLLHGCQPKFLSHSTHRPSLIKHPSQAPCLVPN